MQSVNKQCQYQIFTNIRCWLKILLDGCRNKGKTDHLITQLFEEDEEDLQSEIEAEAEEEGTYYATVFEVTIRSCFNQH